MTTLRCTRCGKRLTYEEYRDHDCREDDPDVDRGEGIVADGLGGVLNRVPSPPQDTQDLSRIQFGDGDRVALYDEAVETRAYLTCDAEALVDVEVYR